VFERIFHPEAYEEIMALDDTMKGKALVALDKLESHTPSTYRYHSRVAL
jgi:hypothetical protein